MIDNFMDVIKHAQGGCKPAAEKVFIEFQPLIKKYSYIGSTPDDDLLGELYLVAFNCILRFRLDEKDKAEFLNKVGHTGA